MNLAFEPTDGVDFGNARRVAHLRTDHPVLQGAQIGGGPPRTIGLARIWRGVDGVHEDLAQAGRDRTQLRFQPFRNLRTNLLQPFGDLLPCEVQVCTILKHHRHL